MVQGAKCRAWLALWLAFLVSQGALAAWPVADVAFQEVDGQSSRYVYVPEGQRFRDVRLSGVMEGYGGEYRLGVRLDGRLVHHASQRGKHRFAVDLPDLEPGFHRLDFQGMPAMYSAMANRHDTCPIPRPESLLLEGLQVEYRVEETVLPALKALPDGLFNRSHPDGVRGGVWIAAADKEAYTAAARLISWFDRQANVTWTMGRPEKTADFAIVIRRDPSLGQTARIELGSAPHDREHAAEPGETSGPPTLTIAYRQTDALRAAVFALLDDEQRSQLHRSHADIVGPHREPEWATLSAPASLADLGIEDLRLSGASRMSLRLAFPPHWEPVDRVEGSVRLRGQDDLPAGTRLDIWLDDALAASQALDELTSHDIERYLPLTGEGVPAAPSLRMELAAELEIPRPCYLPLPGTLWIDASESDIHFEHMQKTGVMAFVPRLLADPRVVLPAAHADDALQLLTALMRAHRLAATAHPVPYQLQLLSDDEAGASQSGDQPPTVAFRVDAGMADTLLARYPERLHPGFVERALWWKADAQGRSQLVAGSPDVLRDAAEVLPDSWPRIPDGAREVLIHSQDGSLVVLDVQSRVMEASPRPLTQQQLEWGLLLLAGLFGGVVVTLLWVGIRRRRRRA